MTHELLTQPRTLALLALLCWCVTTDLRARRIPNAAVGCGIAVALVTAVAHLGPVGAGSAIGGMLLGGGLLMPLYLLRAMGAGDVKLMAAVGAFVGLDGIFVAIAATLIGGALCAIAYAGLSGRFGRLLRNTRDVMVSAGLEGLQAASATSRASAGRIPYAIPIAAGTVYALLSVGRIG